MTQIVRKAPSGPILFEVGEGFTTKRNVAQVTGSTVTIPSDATPAYLGSSADAADAAIASIANVKADHVYRAEVSVLLDYSKVLSTTSATLVVEYSTNGTTWNTWKDSTVSVPLNDVVGGPPNLAGNGLFRQSFEVRSSVDAITVADGDTLQIRASVFGVNGVGGMFYRAGSTSGLATVALAEELAS